MFDQWRLERNEAVLKESYSDENNINESVNEMSQEQLDFALARSEVRREDGQEYPGKTLYGIIGSIQTFSRVQCKRNVTLIDKKGCAFRSLNSALNFQKKEKAAQGVGVVVNQPKFITEEQENVLWENGFSGSENGEILCYTVVWVFGIEFAFRAGQEHRNLRLKNSQLCLGKMTRGVNSCSTRRLLAKPKMRVCAICVSKGKLFMHRKIQRIQNVAQSSCIKSTSHVPKEISDNALFLFACFAQTERGSVVLQ